MRQLLFLERHCFIMKSIQNNILRNVLFIDTRINSCLVTEPVVVATNELRRSKLLRALCFIV